MKRRILFVDDDPAVLEDFKQKFQPLQDQWEPYFVSGGDSALELFKKTRCDVVIADLRMPGMDGAALLTELATHHPRTIRIILVDNGDDEAAIRCLDSAHQCLRKPCDPKSLQSAVHRVGEVVLLLQDRKLKRLVSKITALPSRPTIYSKVLSMARSPNSTLEDIGVLISQDPGMTAKMLQLVNSSFFGVASRVSNPVQAVRLLGLDLVRALVLSVRVFAQFEKISSQWISVAKLWQHSLRTADLAKKVMGLASDQKSDVDEAFTAGILHEIGKLVMAGSFPQECEDVARRVKMRFKPSIVIERQAFGATHAEVGAYLLGLWHLPTPIVEAVAYHHNPSRCVARGLSCLTVLHVVDAMTDPDFESIDDVSERDLDLAYLEEVGVIDQLPRWQEICAQTQEEVLCG